MTRIVRMFADSRLNMFVAEAASFGLDLETDGKLAACPTKVAQRSVDPR
jgi:hypothetical protein